MRHLVALLGLIACGSAASAVDTTGYGQVFPADNPWNQEVTRLPVHARSDHWVASIGTGLSLHPDFGTGDGIPYVVVPGTQPRVAVGFDYADESDPGPYPIPPDAPIEGGGLPGDAHVLVIDRDHHALFETFASQKNPDGSWHAASGAVFDLTSNAVRPAGWTSSDAAGLPVFAGLARRDEVATGAITHALRLTIVRSQKAYLYPARHYASSITDPDVPPMGARFRLKATADTSTLTGQALVIAVALQRFGLIVADNGGNWYVSGAPDAGWDDATIDTLKRLHGSDFEAVDTSAMDPAQNTMPPATPTGVAASLAGGVATVRWTGVADTDLLGYHVERASSSAGPWQRQTSAPIFATTWSQSGIASGATWSYRVIAEDRATNLSTPSAAAALGGGTGTTGGTTTGGTTTGSTTGGTTGTTTGGTGTTGTSTTTGGGGSGTTSGSGGTTTAGATSGGTASSGGGSGGHHGCGAGSAIGVAAGIVLLLRRAR